MGRLSDLSLATQVAVFNNKRAFDQLVHEYQSPLRRFFLNQTLGNKALSDDLAQDTFLKAYTHIGQYRGTSTFLTWLTRIGYNVWYDYKRKNRTPFLTTDGGESTSNAVNMELHHHLEAPNKEGLGFDLYRALSMIRDEERTCITLQLVDGYQIEEIASITGMPTGTIKSHLKRGKERLANYLRQNGYDR